MSAIAPRVLVMGVGNVLLCDEGFGVRAVQYMQDHYSWPENVHFLAGETGGIMLMPEIQACDLLVVLDVVLGGEAPGTVYLLENEDLRKSLSFRDSMHQTDLIDTLATCELAGHRPDTIAFGLQPFDYHSMVMEISPQAEAMLPVFCQKAVAELARRGIVATPR